MKYEVGQKVLHPYEGVGTIIGFDENTINDTHVQFTNRQLWVCSGALVPVPAEDDKEYREFVEWHIGKLETERDNLKENSSHEKNIHAKFVQEKLSAHLTRLIADIKKGMEQNTWSDADMVEFGEMCAEEGKLFNPETGKWDLYTTFPTTHDRLTAWQQQKKGGGDAV